MSLGLAWSRLVVGCVKPDSENDTTYINGI